jgi:hypothetical protein
MVERFLASGRTGFHVAVAREGTAGAGDELQRIAQVPLSLAKTYGPAGVESVRRASPGDWRRYFTDRLEKVHVAAQQRSGA